MMNKFDIKNMNLYYGDFHALKDVNLEVKEGEKLVIIGPSGSGKSTLLNMLGALDLPDSGSINVAGYDLNSNNKLNKFRAQKIGFVFQLHNLTANDPGHVDPACNRQRDNNRRYTRFHDNKQQYSH